MDFSTISVGDQTGDSWAVATTEFVEDIDDSDSFGAKVARQRQARLLAVERKSLDWAKSGTLLTATASTTWPSGGSIPPLIHLKQGILRSMQARQRALSRALDGHQWRAIRVYGVDQVGYLHLHMGVYIGDKIDCSILDGWKSAHTSNAPLAGDDAHGDGAIRVDNSISNESPTWLESYLSKNGLGTDTTGDGEHGISSAPTAVQRGAVVLDRADVAPMTFGRTT